MYTTISNVKTHLEALMATGQTLEYIKKLYLGDLTNRTVIEFPLICLGPVDLRVEAQTIGKGIGQANNGSDELTFSMTIDVGTRNHNPDVAFLGSTTTGEKGILEICDDLRGILRAETFSGAFTRPANITNVQTGFIVASGNHIWVARLIVEGRRKEHRPR